MSEAIRFHDKNAKRFDQTYLRSPRMRQRLRLWNELIATHVPAGARVLDAGCGPGRIALLAADRAQSVLCLDASAAMIAQARNAARSEGRANLEFICANLCDHDVLEGKIFDAIICSSLLEYLDDWQKGLALLCAHLKPQGVMIISLPNVQSLYRRLERLCFRLTAHPIYLGLVASMPEWLEINQALAENNLTLLKRRTAGHSAPINSISSLFSLGTWIDPMLVLVLQKAA